MTAKPALTVLFGAIAIAASWFAWREFRAAGEARATLAREAQVRAALQGELARAAEHNRFLARHRAELEARTRQPGSPAAPAAEHRRPALTPEAGMWVKIALDPRLQNLEVKRTRAYLALQYGEFFHARHWRSDQIAQFEDLLTAHDAQRRDIVAAAVAMGLQREDPEIAALLDDDKKRQEADVAALLGPEANRQLEDFRQGEAARNVAGELASELLFTASPLSTQQSAQLVQVLQATRSADPATSGATAPGGIGWEAALKQAAAFLSPAQQAEFESTVAGARYREAQNQVMKMITAWEHDLPAK